MKFSDPKVRQAILSHIRFAIDSVEAAIPVERVDETKVRFEESIIAEWKASVRIHLVSQILSFTLYHDFRFQNSIKGLRPQDLSPENAKPYEDFILED